MQNQKKVVSITVQRVGDSRVWVTILLSLLQEEYISGQCHVDYSDDFRCNVTALDEEAARAFEEDEAELAAQAAAEGEEYACSWGDYIVQGVRHGFRMQNAPDRRVIVTRLEGCLGVDGDVEGIIWAATLGVSLLLNSDVQVETPGWRTARYNID